MKRDDTTLFLSLHDTAVCRIHINMIFKNFLHDASVWILVGYCLEVEFDGLNKDSKHAKCCFLMVELTVWQYSDYL
jgi:hypothetical protein